MSKNFFSCIILCGLFCCRQTVEIITDRTLNTREYSFLSKLPQGQSVVVTGLYGQYTIGRKTLPAIRTYHSDRGIGITCLKDSLDLDYNTLVEVSGLVGSMRILFGVENAALDWPVLHIESSRFVKDLKPFLDNIDEIYKNNFTKISDAIFIKESHLELPAHPLWNTAWEQEKEQMIVYLHCSDLMYTAEISVNVALRDMQKVTICAMQNFKGE